MPQLILMIIGIYIATGLLFALYFAVKGAVKLDPVATGSPLIFQAMIIPGATALWPLLLFKLLNQRRA